jgi:diol dehydratase reactivase alpha subunit
VGASLGQQSTPATAPGWAVLGPAGSGRRVGLLEAAGLLRGLPVGAVSAYGLPGGDGSTVDDLFAVDLAAVADTVLARVGAQESRAVALAVLRTDAPFTDPAAAMAARLGIEVRTVRSEAAAARAGALTTPGSEAGAVVVDVGGGTVDVVSPHRDVVAAGAGELLTVGVAALTGASAAAAEWVKRGPAVRVETPQLLLHEDGVREFLDRPAGREVVGKLAVRGPAGLLAFDRQHAPGEWRSLRLRLKAEVLGGNVARALATLAESPQTVVVVGGPAGDDEVLASVARVLPDGVAVGRGNVGGSLGHRYAVAYGLVSSTV